MMLINLSDVPAELAHLLGGKATNTMALASRLDADPLVGVAVPKSWIALDLNGTTAGTSVASLPHDGVWLVRSSSVKEDAGDSTFSGLLESIVVSDDIQLMRALTAIASAAIDLDANPVSALLQEVVQYDVGMVIGVVGDPSGPLIARAEFCRGKIPVEAAPDGWLHVERSADRARPGEWDLVDEDGALVADLDLPGAVRQCIQILDRGWAETESLQWFAELEVAVVGAVAWCVQIRFDLRRVPPWSARKSSLVRFGADRNFPVPVTKLTASVLAPVLAKQFNAPIVLDEVRQVLVCRATSAPPATFRERCVQAVRRDGPMDLAALAEVTDGLNELWRRIVDLRTKTLETQSLESALNIIREAPGLFNGYFETDLFKRAVGTEILLAHKAGSALPEFDLIGNRAQAATDLHRVFKSNIISTMSAMQVSVVLFGDDSLGSLRLIDKSPLDDKQKSDVLELFFRRHDLLTAGDYSHLRVGLVDSEYDVQCLVVALWAQDFDNQIKDGVYHLINLALQAIADSISASPEDLLRLTVAEILECAEQPGGLQRLALLVDLRSGTVSAPPTIAIDEASRRPLRPTLYQGADGGDLIISRWARSCDGSVILADDDEVRRETFYVIPSLAPLEALEMPPVLGLWLYELGELAHAAHILRTRDCATVLILGQAEWIHDAEIAGQMRVANGEIKFGPKEEIQSRYSVK